MDRRNYLEILSEQIRCKRALPLVTGELEVHIDEQKADFMTEGMTEREAEEAAVREMGDPVAVGVEMDRIHRPKMNWRLIFGIGAVSLLGMVFLCMLDVAVESKDMPFFYLAGHLFYLVIGYGAMIVICYVDYTWIARRAKGILAGYILLLAVGTSVFGTTVNGARFFVNFFGLALVNVNQWVLLMIPLCCAVLYSYRGQGILGLVKGVLWMAPVVIAQLIFRAAGIIVLIPALAVILSVAVWKGYFQVHVGKTLAAIWGVTALFPCGLCLWLLRSGAGYQTRRIEAMFNPGKYAQAEGYQLHSLRKLLEGSRFIGEGKNFAEYSGMVPDNSSFALAYIMSCFGILAAVCVISMIAILVFKLTAVTIRQKNRLGCLMGAGCGVTIALQAVWYVMTNLGLVLVGPVYCPFITRGGSGMVITYILCGIMLSIYRYQNVAAEVPLKKDTLLHFKGLNNINHN